MNRRRLPVERASYTAEFKLPYTHKDGKVDIMKFYFTVGLYEDGQLGEVFAKADKQGTLVSGVMDNMCIVMSIGLQYGIPLDVYLGKMRHSRFPPSGTTGNPDFPTATSPLDLLAQWLEAKFIFVCNDPQCGQRIQKPYNGVITCKCKGAA